MTVIEAAKSAIEAAIPGAVVSVSGAGGHFEIQVISDAFAGKRELAKQRMVLSAIAPLMAGAEAPIHAVDTLICRTP